jgi:hypothetical protein
VDPAELTVVDARAAIAGGELSPVELLDAVLRRVADRNDELRAYLFVDEDGAREAARAAEAAARQGDDRPLLGIPICVKDVIDVAGMPTTAGAAHWRPRARRRRGRRRAAARRRRRSSSARATRTSSRTASTGAIRTGATCPTHSIAGA